MFKKKKEKKTTTDDYNKTKVVQRYNEIYKQEYYMILIY